MTKRPILHKKPTPGYCPIIKVEIENQVCPVENCMYRSEKTGSCGHHRLTEELPENQADRATAVCNNYRVTLSELQESQTRIREALEANRFFEFLFGKPITEARSKDIQELKDSEEKYESWNGKNAGEPVGFDRIARMAEFIATKL